LPFITAAALADGEITDRQFERSRFTDPKLLELVAKIKVTRNAELSAKYAIEVGNIVSIRLNDGRTLSKRVDVPPGNAKRPLTDPQVQAKFHSMADEVIGKERAGQVANWVWKLDEKSDAGELMPLLVVK
jgi:2-methylcitrate dehydratase